MYGVRYQKEKPSEAKADIPLALTRKQSDLSRRMGGHHADVAELGGVLEIFCRYSM